MLKIPYVIPIAFGLVGTPVYAVPIIFGTIVFYMTDYLKEAASSLKGEGAAGMISQVTSYAQQVFQNKEMIVSVFAFIIVLLLVYTVRRMAINYAWKTAVAAGAVAGIAIVFAGSMMLGVKVSYLELILGNIAAVIVGLVLEFLFFSVDYSRCESVQYEDDEYYYYVKAVPKLDFPGMRGRRSQRRGKEEMTQMGSLRSWITSHLTWLRFPTISITPTDILEIIILAFLVYNFWSGSKTAGPGRC